MTPDAIQYYHRYGENWYERLTKIRIASHSLFHLSVVFLSSSSDRSRYIVNKASDLSTDFGCADGASDSPGSGTFGGEAACLCDHDDDGDIIRYK